LFLRQVRPCCNSGTSVGTASIDGGSVSGPPWQWQPPVHKKTFRLSGIGVVGGSAFSPSFRPLFDLESGLLDEVTCSSPGSGFEFPTGASWLPGYKEPSTRRISPSGTTTMAGFAPGPGQRCLAISTTVASGTRSPRAADTPRRIEKQWALYGQISSHIRHILFWAPDQACLLAQNGGPDLGMGLFLHRTANGSPGSDKNLPGRHCSSARTPPSAVPASGSRGPEKARFPEGGLKGIGHAGFHCIPRSGCRCAENAVSGKSSGRSDELSACSEEKLKGVRSDKKTQGPARRPTE